jgi:ParB-like chromosome segregation protein Spo0J
MESEGAGALLPAGVDDLPSATVPLSFLVTGDSPRRSGENPGHARILAELEDNLPPIIVHRPTMRVIDGMHRLRAARLRGAEKIEVRFFDGDEASAFVLAVQQNITHGLPLSLADRKAAADRIISFYPHWSDRVIASVTGLSGPTVAARRRLLAASNLHSDTRIGMDGRIRPVDPAQRRQAATQLLADNPGASLREVARQAGLSPETIRRLRAQPAPVNGLASPRLPTATRLARAGGSARTGNMAVQALLADPAFRFTDNGRALLRLLTASRALHDSDSEFIEKAPAHCLGRLVEAARACARDWEAFAAEVERRRALPENGGLRLGLRCWPSKQLR